MAAAVFWGVCLLEQGPTGPCQLLGLPYPPDPLHFLSLLARAGSVQQLQKKPKQQHIFMKRRMRSEYVRSSPICTGTAADTQVHMSQYSAHTQAYSPPHAHTAACTEQHVTASSCSRHRLLGKH